MHCEEANEDDLEFLGNLSHLLRMTLVMNVPNEQERPGAMSLVVAALVGLAGELLSRVAPAQRASAIAHYQTQMEEVALGTAATKH